MGLFDTIFNSYKPLGEEFFNKTFQTKNLISAMNFYWISTNGELYEIDYSQCYTYEDNPEFDPNNVEFNIINKIWISPMITVSTGKHGRIFPCYITEKIVMYTTSKFDQWVEATLYFKLGKIQSYTTKINPLSEVWKLL